MIAGYDDVGRISIHAPMRGRPPQAVYDMRDAGFQSTPPCGGDDSLDENFARDADFNPRPHAGATCPGRGLTAGSRFQSTPPCGGDIRQANEKAAIEISIHAPMRGRQTGRTPWSAIGKFQSTPPCGGDFQHSHISYSVCNFNPRPHAGATANFSSGASYSSYFNPRPHAGATLIKRLAPTVLVISIHAPMRGRLHPVAVCLHIM